MLYPGLFEYGFFRRSRCFRVGTWPVAGEDLWLLLGGHSVGFPYLWHWLWTFELVKVENGSKPLLTRQSPQTAPKG
jgi:hypothetical protein